MNTTSQMRDDLAGARDSVTGGELFTGVELYVQMVLADAVHKLKAEVDVMRRERDELAARLAEIERAEPVAWAPMHPRTGALWSMTTGSPDPERLPHYPLMPLYTR